jgi:photosystem II stability/assembly factor-like uncharacterized protein
MLAAPSQRFHRRVQILFGLVLLFVLGFSARAAARSTQDRVKYTIPSPPDITLDVFFLNAKQGWALVGHFGEAPINVLMTDDGGMHWQKVATTRGIGKVFFLNATQGWALSVVPGKQKGPQTANMYLSGTTDGGKTWRNLSQIAIYGSPDGRGKPREGLPLDLLFIDSMHGWVVGQGYAGDGMFLKTDDGGKSLSEMPGGLGSDEPVYRIVSDFRGHICVLGKNTILASLDSGKNWRPERPEDNEGYGLWAGWMFPEGHWLATGINLAILSTSDYGAHWKLSENSLGESSKGSHVLYDVSFYDHLHGCAVLDWSMLVCTADGGQSWSVRTVPRKTSGPASFDLDNFRRIVLLPSGNGWLVSDGGWLYQTKDFGQTWTAFDLLQSAS